MGRRGQRQGNRHTCEHCGLCGPRDGRQQCRAYRRKRRQDVQAPLDTERHTLPLCRQYNRQRRRRRSQSRARRNVRARIAGRFHEKSVHRPARAHRHALSQRARRARRSRQGRKRYRHDQARHRSVLCRQERPYRHTHDRSHSARSVRAQTQRESQIQKRYHNQGIRRQTARLRYSTSTTAMRKSSNRSPAIRALCFTTLSSRASA